MRLIRNKKGDLTSTQIILLLLAVIGFVIVLAALFLVNLGGYGESDICQLSVLTRATAPSAAQAAIPLKCKTTKVCITDTLFGGCKEQFAGEDNVEYVRLSGDIANKRRIIEETSANAMYDCWSNMGEGKLDLFAHASELVGLSSVGPTCVICSRVAVDKGVEKSIFVEYLKDQSGNYVLDENRDKRPIAGVDINNYMKTHQVPGQEFTYLRAFTDRGVNAFADVPDNFDITTPSDKISSEAGLSRELEEARKAESAGGSTSDREMAFVFMQIKSSSIKSVLINMAAIGGTATALTFMSPAGKIASTVGSRVLFTPWGAVAAVIGVAGVASYGAYNAYQGQLAAAGYCGEFADTSEKAKEGCSMVQGLNYNFNEINHLCGSIQGEL